MTHRKQITDSITKYMDLARDLFPSAHLPDPSVTFNMKGGRTFGSAHMSKWAIRINDKVAAKYVNDAVNDTAPHEVAHLVAYRVHGKCQGHNEKWKRIMRAFGVAPDRCADSSLDTLEFRVFKAQTKHHYHCSDVNCIHKISTGMHRKMSYPGYYRTCKLTRGKLDHTTFVKTERKSAATRKAEAYAKAGIPLPGAKPVRAAAKKVKTTRPTPLKKPGTKKARAEAIYRNSIEDRPTIIKRFMRELSMTEAGAATYYANCVRAFG